VFRLFQTGCTSTNLSNLENLKMPFLHCCLLGPMSPGTAIKITKETLTIAKITIEYTMPIKYTICGKGHERHRLPDLTDNSEGPTPTNYLVLQCLFNFLVDVAIKEVVKPTTKKDELSIDQFRNVKFSLAARPRGHKQRKLNDHVYSFFFCLCPLGLALKLNCNISKVDY